MKTKYTNTISIIILFYICLWLQSCSSTWLNKSNITPITGGQLLSNDLLINRSRTLREEGRPLVHELRRKISQLEDNNFVGGTDLYNDQIEKHFMFIFYYWLMYNQSGKPWDDRIPDFSRESDEVEMLAWTPVRYPVGRKPIVQFKLNDLFTERDPYREENLNRKRLGNAPQVLYNGAIEDIEIDHMFKNNNVTIELPETLHEDKTEFIDNLFRPYSGSGRPNRDPHNYWLER